MNVFSDLGERKQEEANVFKPRFHTWIFTSIGIIGYVITILFLFFGLSIMYFAGLRVKHWNWGLASLISALILFLISYYMIQKLGAKYLKFTNDNISLKTIFGRTKNILEYEILHVEIEKPKSNHFSVTFSSPKIKVVTYDNVTELTLGNWRKQQQLLTNFEDLSQQHQDVFSLYYHRSKTNYNSFLIRLSQDSWGIIGLTLVTIYLFLAIWGAFVLLIQPINSLNVNTLFLRNPEFGNGDLPGYNWDTARYQPPSNTFWFGTDWIGRDIFSRMVFGTTFTFMVAIAGSLMSILIVILLGYTSAIYDGWWDSFVVRASDALLTFPPFIPLILISTIATPIRLGIQGGYFLAIFAALSFFTWPIGTRILRAEVLKILDSEYIEAARHLGADRKRILIQHVIPKTVPTVMIIFTYAFTDVILGMTLLGFIGLDSETTLTWGSDLAKAVKFSGDIFAHWWTVFFPSLWIFLLVFGLTILADSIRDNLDPNLRGGINSVPYEMRSNFGDE